MAVATIAEGRPAAAKPWYTILYVQVLFAIVLGVIVGWLWPSLATNDWIKALGVDLTFGQQLTILIVAMLTSKGASGVTGAGFITLAATLSVVNPALVPGMAIVFSIDKFMSEVRALTNITGNGIAAVVVSWWEDELDREKLHANLNKQIDPSDLETAVTTG